jgi:hypothetical protein
LSAVFVHIFDWRFVDRGRVAAAGNERRAAFAVLYALFGLRLREFLFLDFLIDVLSGTLAPFFFVVVWIDVVFLAHNFIKLLVKFD